MECYQLWMNFKTQVDQQLDQFIASEVPNTSTDDIMASIERLKQCDPGLLSCIDYLMAAADYQDFVDLMLDFKDCDQYEEYQ